MKKKDCNFMHGLSHLLQENWCSVNEQVRGNRLGLEENLFPGQLLNDDNHIQNRQSILDQAR